MSISGVNDILRCSYNLRTDIPKVVCHDISSLMARSLVSAHLEQFYGSCFTLTKERSRQ